MLLVLFTSSFHVQCSFLSISGLENIDSHATYHIPLPFPLQIKYYFKVLNFLYSTIHQGNTSY